jgi:hypothetical protein
MRISRETKARIIIYNLDGIGSKRIRQLLLEKNINHSVTGISHVLNKWRTSNTIEQKTGSGSKISQWRIQSRNVVKSLLDPPGNAQGLSIRRTASRLGSNYSSIRRIAREDLKLKVYKKKSLYQSE